MTDQKKQSPTSREYYRLTEIENIYGVPAETVRKWVKRDPNGGVPPLEAFKPGKDILIKKTTFENYLKQFKVA